MSADALNDDCLFIVFRKLPLQERIHLRIVCQRWKILIEADFRIQTSLKLFGSFLDCLTYSRTLIRYNLEDDSYYKLSARHVSDQIILYPSRKNGASHKNQQKSSPESSNTPSFLAHLFPHVKHFIGCFSNKTQFDMLCQCLHIWSDSLVSVSLFMYPYEGALWEISLMKSLKRLDLMKPFTDKADLLSSHLFYDFVNKAAILSLTPCLLRLDHLSLGYFVLEFESIISLIGPNMKRLMLQWREAKEFLQVLQPSTSANFVNVTHLALNNTRVFANTDMEALRFVAEHFPSLTTFAFTVNKYFSFELLMKSLGTLKHLTDLKLCFHTHYDLPFNDLSVPPSVNLKSSEAAPLVSIKKLHLKNAHFLLTPGLLFDVLARFFPCIQELIVSERCSKLLFARMKFAFNGFSTWREWKGNADLEPLQRQNLYWISLRDDLSDFVGAYRQRYCQYMKKLKNAKKEAQKKKDGIKRVSSLQIFNETNKHLKN